MNEEAIYIAYQQIKASLGNESAEQLPLKEELHELAKSTIERLDKLTKKRLKEWLFLPDIEKMPYLEEGSLTRSFVLDLMKDLSECEKEYQIVEKPQSVPLFYELTAYLAEAALIFHSLKPQTSEEQEEGSEVRQLLSCKQIVREVEKYFAWRQESGLSSKGEESVLEQLWQAFQEIDPHFSSHRRFFSLELLLSFFQSQQLYQEAIQKLKNQLLIILQNEEVFKLWKIDSYETSPDGRSLEELITFLYRSV